MITISRWLLHKTQPCLISAQHQGTLIKQVVPFPYTPFSRMQCCVKLAKKDKDIFQWHPKVNQIHFHYVVL